MFGKTPRHNNGAVATSSWVEPLRDDETDSPLLHSSSEWQRKLAATGLPQLLPYSDWGGCVVIPLYKK